MNSTTNITTNICKICDNRNISSACTLYNPVISFACLCTSNTALNSLLHTALAPTDYTLLMHGLLICHLTLQHLQNDK
jgi:hypothetical protein